MAARRHAQLPQLVLPLLLLRLLFVAASEWVGPLAGPVAGGSILSVSPDADCAATHCTFLGGSDDDLDRLNTVSALPPEYPGWMQAMQHSDRAPGTARDWEVFTKK